MRIKIRFSGEGLNQPAMVLDLRFLPREGEHIRVGFRRVIEVLEVHRVDNDNRCGAVVRAKYIQEHSNIVAPLMTPRPMVNPLPAAPIHSLGVSPAPATAAKAALYGNLSLEELRATQAETSGP